MINAYRTLVLILSFSSFLDASSLDAYQIQCFDHQTNDPWVRPDISDCVGAENEFLRGDYRYDSTTKLPAQWTFGNCIILLDAPSNPSLDRANFPLADEITIGLAEIKMECNEISENYLGGMIAMGYQAAFRVILSGKHTETGPMDAIGSTTRRSLITRPHMPKAADGLRP
ncbi:hypothetical protein MMC06_005422 [Schaereria dolodes]|nr:hypothetical protein [Schaereria dolodes]